MRSRAAATALALALAAPGLAAEVPAFVQTGPAGDRLRPLPPPRLRRGTPPRGPAVVVRPGEPLQAVEGFGGALTESSAYVLAMLPPERRREVLDLFFGPTGAAFTLARVPVGACDFSVEGRWSYDDAPGDEALAHFSIEPDRRGFKGARDPGYALLPLVKEALAREPGLKLMASPWSAPAWMKDNGDWYGQGRGGTLLERHHDTFARYMVRYLQAYAAEGVRFWAVTPENEPMGNGGQWESMEFTPEAMASYVGLHLGPRMKEAGFGDVRIVQYDHNREEAALRFARAAKEGPAAAYVWGTGVHWYESTAGSGAAVLDGLRALWPGKPLLHTEGCVDALADEVNAPGGKFLGWRDDAWWWKAGAADWGHRWAPEAQRADHPLYAPARRYARDMLVGLNHGLAGWIDWNIVLDSRGGPNHVGNLCAAPVMVDTASGEVYVTPLQPVLAHFSRYLRPGDRILRTEAGGGLLAAAGRGPGGRVSVIVHNPTDKAVAYVLRLGRTWSRITIPPGGLQSLRLNP